MRKTEKNGKTNMNDTEASGTSMRHLEQNEPGKDAPSWVALNRNYAAAMHGHVTEIMLPQCMDTSQHEVTKRVD